MAEALEINGKARQAEGEAKVVLIKSSIWNVRNLWGICFIDPEDMEFKKTIENAREKLETSVALAMPFKIMKNCGSGGSNKIKIKLACIPEGDESTRMRVGNSMQNHDNHFALQENVRIRYCTGIWFTNLFLCLKPWKFRHRKQQWTRNGKNWRKFQRGTWQKSEVRNRWSMKQGRRALQFILHHWWKYVIWKMLNGGKAPEIQRSSCAPRWYCER